MVRDPVGQVDLAPTFCAIAGVEPADWMQGDALPTADGTPGRERMLCEWDSQFPGYGMHLRSVYRDGWLCTVYEPSTAGQPNGLEETWGDDVLAPCSVVYEQIEHRARAAWASRRASSTTWTRTRTSSRTAGTTPSMQALARRPGRRPLRQPARRVPAPQGDRARVGRRSARTMVP